MIALVKKYASSRLNDLPFPDRYNSETGNMTTFYNRAVVGGHFALVCCLQFIGVLGADSTVSLKLLVPDVKKGDTNSGGGGGGDNGGGGGGNNGGTAMPACPAVPMALISFVALIYVLL